MKKTQYIFLILLTAASVSSCKKSYKVGSIESSPIVIDSSLDSDPDPDMQTLLSGYKTQIDSIMNKVVGVSSESMSNGAPQSLLANFTADQLRKSAKAYIGKDADFAVMNNGGLRTALPEGDVTVGDLFKIYPFANEVVYIKMKGSDVTDLFKSISKRGGEGISGPKLVIKNRELKSLKIDNKDIDPDAFYWCATIDYLAEGNSGMGSMMNAVEEIKPELLLRDLMIRSVAEINESGKPVTSVIDDRIIVEK